MNGEMVRAVLSGRKTQTRRIIKDAEYVEGWTELERMPPIYRGWWSNDDRTAHTSIDLDCPLGYVGDRLYVREDWCVGNIYDHQAPSEICSHLRRDIGDPPCKVAYPASGGCVGLKVRPSTHMPKWASRITLEITDVRVERLCGIADEDAIAEGIECEHSDTFSDAVYRSYAKGQKGWLLSAKASFGTLWQSIYGPDSWVANPWVFAITFKRIEAKHD